ncbi:MAG TPA: AraC family transcriptional regulator [Sphingomicrobium sp.]|nr:AraC family transcriptional regulator [Sphingomicrobium sp.]
MSHGSLSGGHPFGRHYREVQVAGFQCTLSRATVPKEELPEHIHTDGQIILALDAGYLSRAFAADEHGRGLDLVYNPPGTVHRDCFFESGGRFLSVSAPASVAPPLPNPVRLEAHSARGSAARLAGLCARAAADDALEIEQTILDLLGGAGTNSEVRHPSWLPRAHELIDSHSLEQQASIGAIAGALQLHPVYFARAFRAAVGHGPAKALKARRISAATALLSRDISLAEIASSCGFADQSHLCRSMRQMFGIPPSKLGVAFREVANVQDN